VDVHHTKHIAYSFYASYWERGVRPAFWIHLPAGWGTLRFTVGVFGDHSWDYVAHKTPISLGNRTRCFHARVINGQHFEKDIPFWGERGIGHGCCE